MLLIPLLFSHLIFCLPFLLQLHLVFYNKKCNSSANSVNKPDGLAVLGILISVIICLIYN